MRKKVTISIIVGLTAVNMGIKAQADFIRNIDFVLKIVDDSTKSTIRSPRIISFSTYETFTGDTAGYIGTQLQQTDSIRVAAMGYYPKTIKVAALSQNNINEITLKSFSYMLPEVKVRPHLRDSIQLALHLPNDIHLGMKSDMPMRYRPNGLGTNPTALGMIGNPIYALYFLGSKKEKSKRKVMELNRTDIIRESHDYTLMNHQVIEEESSFTGDSLQLFIIQCNAIIKVAPSDNILIIRQKIRWLANGFRTKKPSSAEPIIDKKK